MDTEPLSKGGKVVQEFVVNPQTLTDDRQAPIPSRARLVVSEAVYHQIKGSDPVTAGTKFTRCLTTEEQAYIRRFKTATDWTPLDTGWLEECSLIMVFNNSEDSTIIEVGKAIQVNDLIFVTTVFRIPKGESLRGTPADLKSLCLKSEKPCKATLYVFPL